MTVKETRLAFAKILNTQYPLEEIDSFFHLLTQHYFGWSKFETHQKECELLSHVQQQHFSEALKRLRAYEPIQYIIGETEFYGLSFKVNEHTLIPRPETEELVAWIIAEWNVHNSKLSVLDIGTGSGCIAISLAKQLKKANVSAIDISEGALQKAQENASLNNVEVKFDKLDILAAKTLNASYDVIVSNPPYVRNIEKKLMQKNVLNYEPSTALFVADRDPLIFYRKIIHLAAIHLKIDGFLYFEINEYLGEEMLSLLSEQGFKNSIIKKDIYGKDRMMRTQR